MNPTDPEILKIGGPIFIALIVLEIILSLRYEPELYRWKDLAVSGTMGIGAAVIAMFSKGLQIAFYFLVYNIFNPENEAGVHVNIMGYTAFGFAWYIWLICQFLDDFSYYWFHRMNHEVRVLWAAHIVHHSSENFNLGTGVRNGWFTLVYKPLFYMWLPAIGFHPIMVIACLVIESLWQFQLHTKFIPHIPFLAKFLNMHDHHRVHHSSKLEYLDKNHGGYLNIFDKVFGTFKEYDWSKDNTYGVLHPPNPHSPWDVLIHEYKHIWQDVKKVKKFKYKFMYVFGPPGWSPDGSTKTVKEIQKQLEQA